MIAEFYLLLKIRSSSFAGFEIIIRFSFYSLHLNFLEMIKLMQLYNRILVVQECDATAAK